MKLAQAEIFGTIAPPTGAPTNPGVFIGGAINIFIIIAGIAMLIYLLYGAFEWIISGGEKEKLVKAQHIITNAIIGMFVVILALALFNLIAVNILHIFEEGGGGWQIVLPKIGGP